MLLLVGHYNPTGEYPAPVVPICRDERQQLFALYGGRFSHRALDVVPVFTDLDFIRHHSQAYEEIREFDAHHQRLFAFQSDDIAIYSQGEASAFIHSIFAERRLRFANPFLNLSLACSIRDESVVLSSLRCCISELGGAEGFTREWYRSAYEQYNLSNLKIPKDPIEILDNAAILRLGCADDKARLLTRLARGFNADASVDWSRELVAVHSMGNDELRHAIEAETIDAAVPETDEWLQGMGIPLALDPHPVCRDALVLALNPAFVESLNLDIANTDWSSVLKIVANQPDFRWIRSRSETAAGMALDGILQQTLPRELIAQLEKRVVRYYPSDAETFNSVIKNGEWQFDAFVARRHSVITNIQDFPSNRIPIVILSPFNEMCVPSSLWRVGAKDETVQKVLKNFIKLFESEEGHSTITRLGFLPGGIPAEVAENSRRMALQAARTQRPVAVYLVADISGSMQGLKLAEAKVGMSTFIGHIDPTRGDALGLITFASTATISVPLQPASSSANAVGTAIATLEVGGNTALLDALVLAWNELKHWENHVRTIVVLTDGLENSSITSRADALSLFASEQRHSIVIFSLAYGSNADEELLHRASEVTGGVVHKGSVTNISKIFSNIAQKL